LQEVRIHRQQIEAVFFAVYATDTSGGMKEAAIDGYVVRMICEAIPHVHVQELICRVEAENHVALWRRDKHVPILMDPYACWIGQRLQGIQIDGTRRYYRIKRTARVTTGDRTQWTAVSRDGPHQTPISFDEVHSIMVKRDTQRTRQIGLIRQFPVVCIATRLLITCDDRRFPERLVGEVNLMKTAIRHEQATTSITNDAGRTCQGCHGHR
jgi:hypothetical protein